MKQISFVIPAYNEEKLLTKTVESIIAEMEHFSHYAYEIVIVNDGSVDNTRYVITELAWRFAVVKGINFSRNFGKEVALSAGLDNAHGDAVITLDADGQHPIDKISHFLAARESGYAIVYNKRPNIQDAWRLKRISSFLFYKFFNSISEFKLEAATTDYRLLDSSVVQVFRQFKERNRIFRWLIDFTGFNKTALTFDALPNPIGRKPSYNYAKLLQLAMDSITSFSLFPLKLVGYLGVIIILGSIAMFFLMISDMLFDLGFDFTNLALVVVMNTLLIGIVLMSLWLIAMYIANIHEEVQGRPLYLVKEKIGLE